MAGRGKQAVRNQGGFPAWLYVCIGILVGLLIAAAIFMTGHAPSLRHGDAPVPNPHAVAAKPSEPGIADKTKQYDFYSVLPEKDVVIPDAELSARARAEATQTAAGSTTADAATAADSGGYLLQAGSFPNAADAEAVKARLALLGFVANIQPVTINGNTWNRVRLGPYASAAKLEAAKQKLSDAGIHAIALKAHD